MCHLFINTININLYFSLTSILSVSVTGTSFPSGGFSSSLTIITLYGKKVILIKSHNCLPNGIPINVIKLKPQKINSNIIISNPPNIIQITVPKQPQQWFASESTVSFFLKGHKTKQAIEKHLHPFLIPISVIQLIIPKIHHNKNSSHPTNISQRIAQKQLQQEQHFQHKPLVSTILFIKKIVIHIIYFSYNLLIFLLLLLKDFIWI